MSKGSRQRPPSVNQKTFEDNWDRIFKQKDYKEVQQDITELNGDGNRTQGIDSEDNDKSNSSM